MGYVTYSRAITNSRCRALDTTETTVAIGTEETEGIGIGIAIVATEASAEDRGHHIIDLLDAITEEQAEQVEQEET